MHLELLEPVDNVTKCVDAANEALELIQQGRLEEASRLLRNVKADGEELAEQAQTLVKRLEPVEKHYKEKEEQIKHEIRELGRQVEELKGMKRNYEAEVTNKRALLNDCNRQVRDAKNNLDRARRRKLEEEIKRGSPTTVGAVVGGLLGLTVGVSVGGSVGAAVGVAAGGIIFGNATTAAGSTGISAVMQEYAEWMVRRRKEDCETRKRSLREYEVKVSNVQGNIGRLETEIQQQEQRRLSCHEEADEVKQAMTFMMEATYFWQLFTDAAQHGASRTDLLQKVVNKAKIIEGLNVSKCKGIQTTATSFVKAWACIVNMIMEGGSKNIFQIEFECFRCNRNNKALPRVQGSALMCNGCFHHAN